MASDTKETRKRRAERDRQSKLSRLALKVALKETGHNPDPFLTEEQTKELNDALSTLAALNPEATEIVQKYLYHYALHCGLAIGQALGEAERKEDA